MLPWSDAAVGKDDFAQLVYLSNLIGSDLTLVQPGGGNTSVKLEEEDIFGARVQSLVVKGSGTDLRTITAAGFTHLYLDRLAALRTRESMSDEEMMSLMRACMFREGDPLPSVETPLHSFIPQRFVAHTHDVASLSLTDTPSARDHVERLFGREVAFLEYVRPGFPLAKRMAEKFPDGPPPGAIALAMEKHGLAAWGNTAKECYANLTSVIQKASEYVAEARKGKQVFGPPTTPPLPDTERTALAEAIAPVIRGELARAGWRPILAFDDSLATLEAIDGGRFAEVAARGVMTPEHILRCGVRPLVVTDTGATHKSPASVAEAIRHAHVGYVRYAKDNGQPEPIADWLKVVAIPGVGVFYAGKDRRNALIAGDCYRATIEAMTGAEAVERFEFLSHADACEMEYWPLERRKIAEAPRKDLDGKIALVIGGASGIGQATAARFAREGAHVVVADLNLDRAHTVAADINTTASDRGFAVAANAADTESIEHAVRETVLHFGGLDVLFYSPGIPPELHSVADMPDAEVQEQLRVHYQGAVAATRAASRVMLAQACPEPGDSLSRRSISGRLIYNASKAAFAPGEGAAAYGASKAALVHYVRNAANELSRYGITANYINADAIDTPLFRALVQERALAAGQTEEQVLQRYADRSIFRTATVPPDAVAEAALWLASDRSAYTSGCVITVGGGAEAMPR